MIEKYLRELWYLKLYILFIVLAITASYSVYYFCDPATVAKLGDEDHFFEWWTAMSLFSASVLCIFLFKSSKNIFFILLAVVFFFGSGEEISWGQRLLGFKNPDLMVKLNVQKEFSIHNLEMFNTVDFEGNEKLGLARFLEVNFLFRLFMMAYGIVLPLLVYHIKKIRAITERIKLPVPPVGIGFLFFINWFVFRMVHQQILSSQHGLKYIGANPEIFECMGAFILLTVIFYFYNNRRKIVMGQDIKNYLLSRE